MALNEIMVIVIIAVTLFTLANIAVLEYRAWKFREEFRQQSERENQEELQQQSERDLMYLRRNRGGEDAA